MSISIIISYENIFEKSKNPACFKWMYGLSGNDYIVATLSKLYLNVKSSCKVWNR